MQLIYELSYLYVQVEVLVPDVVVLVLYQYVLEIFTFRLRLDRPYNVVSAWSHIYVIAVRVTKALHADPRTI